MNAIVHRIIESNLSDFKGLAVEGEIPVSEEIINDVIKIFMDDMSSAKSKPNAKKTESSESDNSSSRDEGIDIHKIISALDEKDLHVELKEKQLVIKIAARKY